jgi:ADP-ribose pyrophosphatase YjhB (NUDIX family)
VYLERKPEAHKKGWNPSSLGTFLRASVVTCHGIWVEPPVNIFNWSRNLFLTEVLGFFIIHKIMKKFQIYTRCIVFNKDNQVLLVQKNNTRRIATGKWLLPGGTVEWGEDIGTTLIRETKEEVGMDISIHSILGTRTILLEEDHWIGVYFFASGDASKAFNAEPEKHDAI